MPPATMTRMKPEEFLNESVETPEVRIDRLAPAVRRQAGATESAAKTLLVKALLHRLAPTRFPVSADPASFDAFATRLVGQLPSTTFNRIRPKLERMVDSESERAAVVGRAAFDVQKSVENGSLAQWLNLDPSKLVPPTEKPILKIPTSPTPPKFNRAFLNLRRLQCLDETNPEGGADDMILGGVLIGPSGTAAPIKSFVAGLFDDGTVWNYGSLPLGVVDLQTTPGYPKNLYCVFSLVESDSDDQEIADAVTAACKIAAGFATAIGQGIAAAAFAAVGGLVDAFATMLIDEDHFPPYGIERRLDSEHEFGSDGIDINRRTEAIKGHGGSYRIGYRWELTA